MANAQQLEILKSGAAEWKRWREAHPQDTIDFRDADLAGVDLAGRDLSSANFSHANLEGSNFEGADLHDAKFVQANLARANFSRTNLRDADLTHARIHDANFSRANVSGADLHNVHPSHETVWPPLPRAAKWQYLYLLRVPILMGLVLFALPIVSVTAFQSLLGNLFVLDPWHIFWTMIATVALAFSILVTFRVVVLNGMERFGVQQALTQDKVSIRALLITEALTLPMLFLIVWSNCQAPDAKTFFARLLLGILGMLVAHIGGYFVLLGAALVSPHYPRVPVYPLPDFLQRLFERVYNYEFSLSKKIGKAQSTYGKSGSHAFRAGYFDPRTGLLYPGHWLSFLSLFATLLLYWTIGRLKHAHLGESFGNVPAICYVVLLLLLLTWILGMAAFFLDRYRIPLLLLTMVFIFAGNLTPQSDHYYQTQTGQPEAIRVPPERVLGAESRIARDTAHPRGRVVLVAAEGGGIQAAAWAAQVLTGLQEQVRGISAEKPINFADSIAVISGVSGGAVGTMFFVNRYKAGPSEHGFQVPDNQLSEIVKDAETPALDDVAWALAYPDFWRVFLPYFKTENDRLVDRGLALQDRWSKRGDIRATLNEWRQGVEDGWRPAVIFNSTLVESGEPLLLATTDMPKSQVNGAQRRTFSDLAPRSDIQVATAVRLASTFPFVTPASRDISGTVPYHVVDGGYYDNYGVYSLLEWLRAALESTPVEKRPDVLIIQIHSFPTDKVPEGKGRGWFYQTWAPLQALLGIRTTAQLVRDRDALANFVSQWSDQRLRICDATFEFGREDAPLSWKMNAKQIKNIETEWESQKNKAERLRVTSFFATDFKKCM
ncbi:MAG TPA: pentapeptide repeat-containing protein [Candidatus Angelobacter sp.]